MAFQITVILAGLIVGWARKGNLWNIVNVRLRWLWMVPFSFILQPISIHHLSGVPYEIGLILSYLTLLAFCVINLRSPGVAWTLTGTALNFLVMLVNGLRMPAYIAAVRSLNPAWIPLLKKGEIGKSVAMSSHTHLNFLGDIFSYRVYPQSIISVGDVLFGIGLAIFVQAAMRIKGEESRREAVIVEPAK